MAETATAIDQDKIQAGAEAYLVLCRETVTVKERDEFLSRLERQLGWTQSEVLDLQIRAAEILLDRMA